MQEGTNSQLKTRSCLCARDFVNKVGSGLFTAFALPMQTEFPRIGQGGSGSTFRDLSRLAPFDYMGLFRYYCVHY
jgi:hypothetical protein